MIAYRTATPADGPELAEMAKRSFTETFGSLYPASDLAAFLDRAFGVDGLPSELDDPAFTVRVATEEGRVIGFAKLGPVAFPGDWPSNAVELHQLYVGEAAKGSGVAAALIEWGIAWARERASILYLSVFTENDRAQAFYRRYGFVDVGRNAFRVGNHVDEDRIWRLDL